MLLLVLKIDVLVAGRCEFKMLQGDSCNRITEMMSKVFIESFKKLVLNNVRLMVLNANYTTMLYYDLMSELTHAIVFCNCRIWDKTDSGAGNWTGETRSGNGYGKHL